jgi:hypothetical protein
MKTHWEPTGPVSWPSGGSRNHRMRTFLLAGNIACHADGIGTPDTSAVTCKRCLRLISIARFDTPKTISTVLARGALSNGGDKP